MIWDALRVEEDRFGARAWGLIPTFEFSLEQKEHFIKSVQKIDEGGERRSRSGRTPPKDSKTIRRVNCLEF